MTLDSIGPLQNNGGQTLTHALLSGSAAINGTTAQGCVDDAGDALVIDQRDGFRGAGVACDAGAYEFGATSPVVDRIFANGFGALTQSLSPISSRLTSGVRKA